MKNALYIIYLLALLALSGCSTISPGPNPLTVRVSEAEKGIIDGDIEKESDALHAFLVGQLSYQEEDIDTAVSELSKTSDLLESPQPVIHMQLAQLSLHQGDFDRALSEIRKALTENPDDVYLKYYEAGILDAKEEFEESAKKYQEIIATSPSAEASTLLASVLYRAGNSPKAAEVLSTAKDNSQLKLYEALILEEAGHPAQAAKILKNYIKQSRENVVVDFVLVRNILKSNDFEAARSHLKDMTVFYKDNPLVQKIAEAAEFVSAPEALLALISFTPTAKEELEGVRLELALQAVQAREFKGALRDIMLHLAIHPEDSTARYYLASIFAGAGRRKQAVEEIFKIKPGQEMYVKGRTFAAFILRQDGNLALAEKAAREALAEEPSNQKIISYLILILRGAEKFEEAEELLAESVEREPNNDRLIFSYAVVLNDLGRHEDSLEMMQRVIKINPSNSDALNFVAYSFAESGKNLDEALEYANRALEIRPNDGFYLDTLGWVYYKLGRLTEAEQTLRRAMSLTDEDVVIAEHYGDILRKMGNRDKALEVYTVAVEKARDNRNADEDIVEARLRMEKKLRELVNSTE